MPRRKQPINGRVGAEGGGCDTKRGTLVKLTGDETDEELKQIAEEMYRALLPEMSDDGPP